jgi:hypothetical protein
MTPTSPSVPDSSSALGLLQLHIAEYNALTTRNTYYITIAASFFPVLLLVLTILVAIWNSLNHALLIWASGTVVQLFVLAWIENAWQQYKNLKYIEGELRLLVSAVVEGSSVFWNYERWLADGRHGATLWWEYAPAAGAACTMISVVAGRLVALVAEIHRKPRLGDFGWLDWVGILANIVCFIVVLRHTRELLSLRGSLFHGVQSSSVKLTAGLP